MDETAFEIKFVWDATLIALKVKIYWAIISAV
jgi:hypothetical protein